MEIPFALVNLKDGLENGLALHQLRPIFETYRSTGTRPSLLAINEARWRLPRAVPEREAVHELEQLFGARDEIEIGALDRSDNPPALLWDTGVWQLMEASVAATDRKGNGNRNYRQPEEDVHETIKVPYHRPLNLINPPDLACHHLT